MRVSLLTNASATGNPGRIVKAGDHIFSVDGTFGGATVQLQMRSPDGASWLDIASAAFTAEGAIVVTLPANCEVRASVASGTPSALYAAID